MVKDVFLAILLCLAGGPELLANDPPMTSSDKKAAENGATKDQIALWIDQLAHKNFSVREEATQNLAKCETAVPALRAAASSTDLERRRRAKAVLSKHADDAWANFEREYSIMLKQREIDRLIDGLIHWKGRISEDSRDSLFQMARDAAKEVALATKMNPPDIELTPQFSLINNIVEFDPNSPPKTLDPSSKIGPSATWKRGICSRLMILADSVKPAALYNDCLIVSRETATFGTLGKSLALVNSDVKLGATNHAIIFVGGDLDSEYGLANSIVFCAGDFRGRAYNSIVLAKGSIIETKDRNENSILLGHEKKLFETLRLYDPSRMGIEVAGESGSVRITKILSDTQMSRAGAKGGDRIVSVGDDKVTCVADLTKFLRRKSVEFLPFFLTVERDGKTIELIVPSK
jgi:hypothetical protein